MVHAGRRRAPWAVVLAGALAVSSLLTGCGGSGRPAIELSSCTVQHVPARCGTLAVPENRLTGAGRRIGLRVVVVPATTPRVEPDPIVYLAGGPGDAASHNVADMVAVRGLRNRDIVFVDQRGTGGSHELTCPSPASSQDSPESPPLGPAEAACLRGLDGDPRFYTTSMAADDVADVLRALGAKRANLYGGSYGATIAQVFQRRHPGMVRTMTLLGGTLLEIPIYERMAANSQAALQDVFSRCAADAACSAAFPNLAGEWQSLLVSLGAAPVAVPAERSPTGEPVLLTVDGLAAAVHELLLSADDAAGIPSLVHTLAVASDRVSAVAALAARYSGLLTGDDNLLVMKYVIRCAEDWARFDPAAVARDGAGSYYLGAALENAHSWQQACALFPRAAAAADPGPAVVSDVPVLLINGGADPQDPPSNVAGAARLWPHSLQLVVPHQSHRVSGWRCAESLVDGFIVQGSADGLLTDCLATVPLPPFQTSG